MESIVLLVAAIPLFLTVESEENHKTCQDIRQPDEHSKPVAAE
jgi:hypothetical protein